eukprot:16428813-Heterocapsa_arctica.AAC.1
MFCGQWHTHSWNGSLLHDDNAGKILCPKSGLKAVIWTLSGDVEYYANELGIAKYNSNSPCSWCSCEYGDDRPFND